MADATTARGRQTLPLAEQIERAFDHRGHVTVRTADGRELVGFLSNRRLDGPAPFVELLDAAGARTNLAVGDVAEVRLTGRDPSKRRPLQLAALPPTPDVSPRVAPVAFVAALDDELAKVPLRFRRTEPFEQCRAEHGLAGDRHVLVVATGVGERRARAAMDELATAGSLAAVVSLGFAAGLHPALVPGDVVVLRRIVRASTGESIDVVRAMHERVERALVEARITWRTGESLTLDEPALAASQKSKLGWQGALVADLETFHVADVARQRGLPFAAIRVVVDPQSWTLPSFVGAPDLRRGRELLRPALRHAASSPTGFVDLVRLAHASRRASRACRDVALALAPALGASR